MKKAIFTSFAALAVAFASQGHAAEESYDSKSSMTKNDNGGYERKFEEKSTDAAGTLRKNETTTDVDVDDNGGRETTIKSKSVEDPKGLMNKTTVETEKNIKEEDGKIKTSFEKTVNGKTVEEHSDEE